MEWETKEVIRLFRLQDLYWIMLLKYEDYKELWIDVKIKALEVLSLKLDIIVANNIKMAQRGFKY